MSIPAQDRSETAPKSASMRDLAATQDDATPGEAAVQDGATVQDRAASQGRDSPAALTSLSSLLGGSLEGGAACAADGTCD